MVGGAAIPGLLEKLVLIEDITGWDKVGTSESSKSSIETAGGFSSSTVERPEAFQSIPGAPRLLRLLFSEAARLRPILR